MKSSLGVCVRVAGGGGEEGREGGRGCRKFQLLYKLSFLDMDHIDYLTDPANCELLFPNGTLKSVMVLNYTCRQLLIIFYDSFNHFVCKDLRSFHQFHLGSFNCGRSQILHSLLFSSSLVLLYNTIIRCSILYIQLPFTFPVTEVIK